MKNELTAPPGAMSWRAGVAALVAAAALGVLGVMSARVGTVKIIPLAQCSSHGKHVELELKFGTDGGDDGFAAAITGDTSSWS